MRLLLVSLVCIGLVVYGCGGGGGGGPTKTAESLTVDGWALFEQGKYEEAIDKFGEALELDETYADAYNGLGWSYAKLDELSDALAAFADCIANGMDEADPYAGQAPVYRDFDDSNHFQNAISSATTALSKERRYIFSHYTSFDWHDLMIIIAQSYYGLSEYTSANAWVDSLGGTPADPNSDTFVSDLASEIERLEVQWGD